MKYGGLSKDGEFGNTDAVTEITVRPAAKHTVEFPVNEVGFVLLFSSSLFGFENPMNAALEWGIFPWIPPFSREFSLSHMSTYCADYALGRNVMSEANKLKSVNAE